MNAERIVDVNYTNDCRATIRKLAGLPRFVFLPDQYLGANSRPHAPVARCCDKLHSGLLVKMAMLRQQHAGIASGLATIRKQSNL